MLSVPYISFIFGFINLHPKLESYICASRPYGVDVFEITHGPRVMFSTPPEIIKSASPVIICRAALMLADNPEAHNRLTVSPGTETGYPASRSDMRATLRLSSPAWLAQPRITS